MLDYLLIIVIILCIVGLGYLIFNSKKEFFPSCNNTQFGCCVDGITPANADGSNCIHLPPSFPANPVYKQMVKEQVAKANATEKVTGKVNTKETFEETANTRSALKKYNVEKSLINYDSNCHNTEFGCCIDGITAKNDATGSNCAIPTGVWALGGCQDTFYGCCPDYQEKTDIQGSNCKKVIENFEDKTAVGLCEFTKYGCCQGSNKSKSDPEGSNCCENSKYGCCPNTDMAKVDEKGSNCCENSEYGCCPPNSGIPVEGNNYLKCPNPTDNEGLFLGDCVNSPYKCCADHVTKATGPNFQGCPVYEGDNLLQNPVLYSAAYYNES